MKPHDFSRPGGRPRMWVVASAAVVCSLLLWTPNGSHASASSPEQPPATLHLRHLIMETPRVGWGFSGLLSEHPTAEFGGALLHTVDGGRRWRNVTPPRVTFWVQGGWPSLPHNTATAFLSGSSARTVTETAISHRGTGTLLVSGTRDGGRHWRQWTVRLPHLADRAVPNPIVNQLDFANRRDGWLVFGPDGGAAAGMDPVGMELWRTVDGGHSWIRVTEIPGRAGIIAGIVTFTSPLDGWMTEGHVAGPRAGVTLMHTTNGGGTWQKVPLPVDPGPLASFSGVAVLVVTANGAEVVRSDDGGRRWSSPRRIPGQHGLNSGVEALGGRVIWDLAGPLLWRSTNGGATWMIESRQGWLTRNRGVDFLNQRMGWVWDSAAEGQARIWMTSDGGKHWASWTPTAIRLG